MNRILYGQTIGSLPLLASPLLILVLLFILIYDYVGLCDEPIIMDYWMWMMMWMSFSHTISYILYGRKMRTVQQSIILFTSLLLVLLLVLSVIYDCDGAYDETDSIIMDCMSTYMLNLLSCRGPCPSIPPRKFTTLLFKAYTCNRVMLLIVLCEDVMLVRITWNSTKMTV